MTKTFILLLTFLFSSSAYADTAGNLSKKGDAIEVESYRCEVVDLRLIECLNIGRVCIQAREKEKKQTDYYLGCGLEDWKKLHPKEDCLPIGKVYRAPSECTTLMMGWP